MLDRPVWIVWLTNATSDLENRIIGNGLHLKDGMETITHIAKFVSLYPNTPFSTSHIGD